MGQYSFLSFCLLQMYKISKLHCNIQYTITIKTQRHSRNDQKWKAATS